MENNKHTTADSAKLFLLMIIPFYGFCFTVLLAFSKDMSSEIKALAKGALIARIVFLFALGIGIVVFVGTILPTITEFISGFDANKLVNILNILK